MANGLLIFKCCKIQAPESTEVIHRYVLLASHYSRMNLCRFQNQSSFAVQPISHCLLSSTGAIFHGTSSSSLSTYRLFWSSQQRRKRQKRTTMSASVSHTSHADVFHVQQMSATTLPGLVQDWRWCSSGSAILALCNAQSGLELITIQESATGFHYVLEPDSGVRLPYTNSAKLVHHVTASVNREDTSSGPEEDLRFDDGTVLVYTRVGVYRLGHGLRYPLYTTSQKHCRRVEPKVYITACSETCSGSPRTTQPRCYVSTASENGDRKVPWSSLIIDINVLLRTLLALLVQIRLFYSYQSAFKVTFTSNHFSRSYPNAVILTGSLFRTHGFAVRILSKWITQNLYHGIVICSFEHQFRELIHQGRLRWLRVRQKMSGVFSNGFLNSRIIDKLRYSRDPLSVVKALNQNGTQLKSLNDCAEIGALLCDIVRRNYGLGIKILIDCGLDLSIEDPSTGDTPLLLVCSEGLCGSTKQLIHCLPRSALLHKNDSGGTALKHLLIRGHASCGCLEALLGRLHPCEQILPINLGISDAAIVVEDDTSNPELTLSESVISDSNTIFFDVESLLNRIRSTEPERIFSVLQLWIKYNLFLIHNSGSETVKLQQRNVKSLCNRLVDPMMRQGIRGADSESDVALTVPSKLFHVVAQLIILGQLNASTGWTDLEQFISSSFDMDSSDLGFTKAGEYLGNPMSLQAIGVFRLRQLMQQRFIQVCRRPHQPICEVSDALVFVHWIRSLPIPSFMQSYILLDRTDFHFHH
ncbi:hypothetical protein FGIG_09070 [Fasciola gigantica]|uniref:Uncharacterized protein n=1 Tax=Fasciola gigantica TaxID=46835 RepID=A0A504YJP5_FASGI|nr:hypothetical protein FGIG_09070 [Fasciola gigantica]